jgi:hypothetical protein
MELQSPQINSLNKIKKSSEVMIKSLDKISKELCSIEENLRKYKE